MLPMLVASQCVWVMPTATRRAISSSQFCASARWPTSRVDCTMADAFDADTDVEMFELGDGGMDVAEFLAALGDDGMTTLDDLLEIDRPSIDMDDSPLLLQDDEWHHAATPLPLIRSTKDAVRAVGAEGVARVRAIPEATAIALRAHVLEQLSMARQSSTASAGQRTALFSSVLSSTAEGEGEVEVRWDLRLEKTPEVTEALRVLLGGALGTVFSQLVGGDDAELWELAALISAPGATPQSVHSDTIFSEAPCLFTAFVALQEVTTSNGPTRFLPRSHTAAAHAPCSVAEERVLIAESESSVALLSPGESTVYDGRLRHCGMGNRADDLRVLLYVTFRHTAADAMLANDAAHSIRDEYRGCLSLRDLIP